MPGFDSSAVVVKLASLACVLIVLIQITTDMQIADAVNQHVIAVMKDACTCVEAIARCDNCGAASVAEVVQRPCRNSGIVAIDATSAGIVQCVRDKMG